MCTAAARTRVSSTPWEVSEEGQRDGYFLHHAARGRREMCGKSLGDVARVLSSGSVGAIPSVPVLPPTFFCLVGC